ncbi:MAG: hypothetical protein WKF77_04310 [Planctomycetaceae bacterium]
MTSLATFVLSHIMAVHLCSFPTANTLPDENTLQHEIGKIVGKVIQDLRRKDSPKVMGPAPMPAPQNTDGRSEEDIQKFNARLEAYGSASSTWIVESCGLTDEQQIKLNEILDGQLVRATAKFAKSNDANGQDQKLSRTMPLLFTLPFGPGTDFREQFIAAIRKDLLTEEQTQRLETALGEREEFRNKAYRSYIVAIIDGELFLTSSQREALHSQLTSQWTTLYHPYFAFNPQIDYMPYKSVSTILKVSEGKSFLGPSQERRLQDVSHNQQNSQPLIIGSTAGPDEWARQIMDAGHKHRDAFLRAAAVRVSYYENELQLSAEQVEHLRLASKGAAVVSLADWKENNQQAIDRMKERVAQRPGVVSLALASMDTNTIDQNQIWTDAVSSVTNGKPHESLNQRRESNRTATAQALLAMYDSELWLTPDQRGPLEKLILQTLPSDLNPSVARSNVRDLILMTYPLFKTTEKQRADVISESQQSVWKQMASSFHWQQQNNQVDYPYEMAEVSDTHSQNEKVHTSRSRLDCGVDSPH